jgi:primosomal protein N' (replication factor Y)
VSASAGPLGLDDPVSRMVLLVPRATGAALARALKEAASLRSVRKGLAPVEIRMDPPDL